MSGKLKMLFLDELPEQHFDVVITLCGHANETCPLFPGGATLVHAGFDDPPALAQHASTEAEALVHYRRVRDAGDLSPGCRAACPNYFQVMCDG